MYFDSEGQYICDISHQGRGPGEFLDVSSIFMTGDTLTVASFYNKEKLLRYLITPEGYEPISGVPIKQLDWSISKIFATPDIPGRYFVKNTWNGTPGYTTPLFTIYDEDWNIVDTCRTKHPEGGYASSYPISHAGDRIYLNQAFSDTIYVAYNDRIDPALIIDFIRHERWFLYILQDNGRGRGSRSYVLHIRIPGRQGQWHLPVGQR